MPQAIPYLIEIGKAIAVELARAAVVYAASELLGLNDREPSVDQIQAPHRQTVPPKQKAYGRGRLSGPFLYWVTKDNLTIDIIALAKGPVASIDSFMLNDDEVTLVDNIVQAGADGRYQRDGAENDTIRIYWRTGETPSPVYSEVVSASGGEWTTDHRADAVATMAVICKGVKAEIAQRIYPNGPVQGSAIGHWSLCYDWRKDSTKGGVGAHRIDNPATWEWSENPIVCLLNDEVFERGADFDYRFAPTLAFWTTAANICDEAVEQHAGGTAPRYTMFAFYKSNNPPKNLRQKMLQCCDGLLIERGDGAFVVFAGKYVAPTVTIDEDRLRQIRWTRTRREEDFVNQVAISYQSPAHKWQMVEAAPWEDEDSVDALGPYTAPLELPWVTNNSQARRLGKAAFSRLTAGYVGQFVIDLGDDEAELEQRYLRLRWAAGPSSVHDVVVEITAATVDLVNRLVKISAILADATAYDWTVADEGPAPDVPDVEPPTPIFAPVVVDALVFFSGGAPRLEITIEDPERPAWGYVLEWRVVGEDTWITEAPEGEFLSGLLIVLRSGTLPPEAMVEARVAFTQTSIGPYTEIGPFSTSEIPADAILAEDGSPVLAEDGAFILAES